MGRGKQSGSLAAMQPVKTAQPRLRVLVTSPNAITSAGIVAILRSQPDFEVTSSSLESAELVLLSHTDADVLVLELDDNSTRIPAEYVFQEGLAIVVLITDPSVIVLKKNDCKWDQSRPAR